MKQIIIKKVGIDVADYRMRSAVETDYHTVIKESCVLVDADTGKQLVIYKKLDEEGFESYDLAQALQSIKYLESTRTSGLKTKSRIFGFAPRVAMRKDFCSSTSLVQESPNEHELLCEYGRRIVSLYQANAPEVFAGHEGQTKKVLDEYRIKDTPFTSGIVNKNNPLKYHFDSGNFNNVYSCMLAIRSNMLGGYLSLPEYDCALEISNNSVTIFDGQSILHGVTPFKALSEDAYRFTIVYYSLKRMWECLPIGEEIERVRNTKTALQIKRAEGLAFKDIR